MSEIAQGLVEAAYVADGGQLPKMANHLALHHARYAAIVAAVLRALDDEVRERLWDDTNFVDLSEVASELEAA